MKVVSNSFGIAEINELDLLIGDRKDEDWRIDKEIVELIEKRINEMVSLHELKRKGKITETQARRLCWLIEGDGKESYSNGYSYYGIVEIDGTKPWVLVEYDSSVSAKNIKEPDENNFAGWA